MYIKRVKVAKSNIDGSGVFAEEEIAKDEVVWIFTEGHDTSIDDEGFQSLPLSVREHLEHTSYLSPWTGRWIYPPKGDPAEYTNHSSSNNLTVKFEKGISPEPFFVANRDISIGEEITNNYHDFDEIVRRTNPSWAD